MKKVRSCPDGAKATGQQSIAIGGNLPTDNNANPPATTASGEFAIAVGREAAASAVRSIAMGANSEAVKQGVIAVGSNAGASAMAVNADSVFIGTGAGERSTGTDATVDANVYIGKNAGQDASGMRNTVIGSQNAGTNLEGNMNSGFGMASLRTTTGSENAAFGAYSGQQSTGDNNTSVGAQTGRFVTGSNNTGIGYNAGTVVEGDNNVALGVDAGQSIKASNTISIGNTAKAIANSAIAIGQRAAANAAGSNAMGIRATASGNAATAVGMMANASGSNAFAIGNVARAAGDNAVAMGSRANASGVSAVAIGNNARATAENTISIGTGNLVSGEGSSAVGDPSIVAGTNSFSAGNNNAVGSTTDNAFVLGGQNNIGGEAVTRDTEGMITTSGGVQNEVDASHSAIVGYKNSVQDTNVFVMGNEITVANGMSGAVVLGNQSTADKYVQTTEATVNGVIYSGFAGSGTLTDGSIVSVGAAGAERQIKNVAVGQISATSTDAINGSQLYAFTSAPMWNIYTSGNGNHGSFTKDAPHLIKFGDILHLIAGDGIELDHSTAGTIKISSTVTGSVGIPGKDGKDGATPVIGDNGNWIIDNVDTGKPSRGEKGEDGKDGTTGGSGSWTATDSANNNAVIADNGKVTFNGDNQNITVEQTGADNAGVVEVSLNDDITVNSVTAGDTVVNNDGLTTGNVSVTKTGINAGDNKVTGVKNGDISAGSSDAVNGSQLHSNATSVANALGGGATVNTDGTISAPTYVVTNDPSSNAPVTVHTVGEALSSLTEAVKKPLTFETDSGKYIANLGSTVGIKGDGNNISTSADSKGNITVKMSDTPTFTSVTTGGTVVNNDGITTNNGNGPSLTTSGINAAGTKITNVADGEISATSKDAVNGSQLHAVANNLNNRINKVDSRASAGTASAMAAAGLPQAYLPGHSMVAVAGGTHRGENAIALGVSRISDNGKVIVKLTGATNSENDTSASIGVGYQW